MSHNGLHKLGPKAAPREGAPPLEAAADVRASRRRLLIAEDDEATRRSLAEALEGDGFEVVTAADGREALRLLRAGPRPSAILLDVMMPVMDGWDFRHAQSNDPSLRDIPVLLISASGFSLETIRLQFGNVELFRKPINYIALLQALGRACGPDESAA
jgi:CheY-like chemotaxis protein